MIILNTTKTLERPLWPRKTDVFVKEKLKLVNKTFPQLFWPFMLKLLKIHHLRNVICTDWCQKLFFLSFFLWKHDSFFIRDFRNRGELILLHLSKTSHFPNKKQHSVRSNSNKDFLKKISYFEMIPYSVIKKISIEIKLMYRVNTVPSTPIYLGTRLIFWKTLKPASNQFKGGGGGITFD